MNSVSDLCERLILIGHTKDKYVTKDDKEVTGTEVDLSGKLAGIVTQKVCAIGYAYRKRNALHVSFKTDGNVLNGNRSKHLSGKDIVLSESDPETGEITSYWDRIYID
jgi:putative alpha-1,2-mannosidase